MTSGAGTYSPFLFSGTATRRLMWAWAFICLLGVAAVVTVGKPWHPLMVVPVAVWSMQAAVALWVSHRLPDNTAKILPWMLTTSVLSLLLLIGVNGMGLGSPALALLPLLVLMRAMLDTRRLQIVLIAMASAAMVLLLGWREGAFASSVAAANAAASATDAASQAMALRRVLVLLASVATALVCGLVLASTLRQMMLRQRTQGQTEQFEGMFHDSPAPHVLHRDGLVVNANDAAATLFGYQSGDQMVGVFMPDHFADEADRQQFAERLVTLQGRSMGAVPLPMAVYRVRRPDGRVAQVRATAKPAEFEGARATLTVFIDDTAQLLAERERDDAQALMARMIAVSPYGIALTDLTSGLLVLVNPEFERMTGYSRDQLVGRSTLELGVYKDPDQARSLREHALQAGVVHDVAVPSITRSGTTRVFRGSVAVFSMGQRSYLLSVTRDVTDELTQQMEQRATFDTAPIGLFVVRDHTITLVSRSLEQMLGWPQGSGAGRSAADLMGGQAALQQVIGKTNDGLLRGETVSFDWPLFHGDGTHFTARFTGRVIDTLDPASRRGVVWTVLDVSLDVERERLLERARLDAQANAQAKARFLVHTSHQLRTPLNAVLNLAELARSNDTEPAQREHLLQHIADTAQTLVRMLTDILDLQLFDDGDLPLSPRDFDLGAVTDALRSSYAAQAAARGLRLTVTLAPGADRWVHGDEQRVRQLLGNLLSNAVRFGDAGRIELRIHPLGADRYRFEVQDEGAGITPDDQTRLFEPFAALGGSESVLRAQGGVGLGLALARRITDAMGGQIGVVSAPGQGSTFWVELPLPQAQAPHAEASGYDAPLRGVRLLMAEDDELSTASMTMMLERWGAQVDAVNDGTQAVRAVSAARQEGRPYDLVLMDLHMPMMDGLEATRWIRQELGETSLPILALTASVMPTEVQGAKAAGCSDFISKPVAAPVLLARMVDLIAERPVSQ
ncbi:MAG: PAS domain S-box protein [Burkholderiaceae bacterium]